MNNRESIWARYPKRTGYLLCKYCNKYKKIKYFPPNNKSRCRECTRIHRREMYANNKYVRYATYQNNKKYKQNNWSKILIQAIQFKSKKLNIPFDITENDILNLLTDICPICGIIYEKKVGKNRERRPSIDRIIPSKGYVKDNIKIICSRCNRIKSDATADELIKIGSFYKIIDT